MMRITHILSTVLCLVLITGCKIEVQTPPQGYVRSAQGDLICAANETCTISVTDLFFDTDFVAVPHEGYVFNGWEKRHKGLCGGSTKSCHLKTSGFAGNESLEALLVSDDEFYLTPTFVAISRQEDFEITASMPEVALLDVQHSITFSAENVSSAPKKMGSMYVQVLIGDYGQYDTVAENWYVESDFGGCRFEHPVIQSVLFSSRGTRFVCGDVPVVDPGETLEFILNITPEILAHYEIFGGLGDGFYQRLTVTPSLIDSDSDGAIDVEEELSGSDPFDRSSLPASSEIELLLFYTPQFAQYYPLESERDAFFDGFIDYANQVFLDSGVRIQLNLAGVAASGEVDISGDRFSNYVSDAANRKNGFEKLVELERTTPMDLVGVIDSHTATFERGRADGISSGTAVGYFSAIDDYQVMLHEVGHNLGANHNYESLDIQFDPALRSKLGTYNFSYGYVEGDAGSIMSYAPSAKAFFSNPLIGNCGLSLCGVDGQIPESAANNALALNLRRHFMSNTKVFDEDFDGMPEWWENKHSLITDFNRCKDADADGAPNIEEFVALTDPRDADSLPDADIPAQFCERPHDRTAVFYVQEGETILLNLRTFDSKGYLLEVGRQQWLKNGRLDSYMYGVGLYNYTPKLGFEGTDNLEFPISNGIAGSATFYVSVEVSGSD